jgi:hypothetical protein
VECFGETHITQGCVVYAMVGSTVGRFEYSHEGETYVFDRQPYYIGCGQLRRAFAFSESHKKKVIKRIRSIHKVDPVVIIVKSGLTNEAAFDLEIRLIQAVGRVDPIDCRSGSLVNCTNGGAGRGLRINEKTRSALLKWTRSPEGRKHIYKLGKKSKQRVSGTSVAAGDFTISEEGMRAKIVAGRKNKGKTKHSGLRRFSRWCIRRMKEGGRISGGRGLRQLWSSPISRKYQLAGRVRPFILGVHTEDITEKSYIPWRMTRIKEKCYGVPKWSTLLATFDGNVAELIDFCYHHLGHGLKVS